MHLLVSYLLSISLGPVFLSQNIVFLRGRLLLVEPLSNALFDVPDRTPVELFVPGDSIEQLFLGFFGELKVLETLLH